MDINSFWTTLMVFEDDGWTSWKCGSWKRNYRICLTWRIWSDVTFFILYYAVKISAPYFVLMSKLMMFNIWPMVRGETLILKVLSEKVTYLVRVISSPYKKMESRNCFVYHLSGIVYWCMTLYFGQQKWNKGKCSKNELCLGLLIETTK